MHRDAFGGESSRALRMRGLSHYQSVPGKDLLSLSLSVPTCTVGITVSFLGP